MLPEALMGLELDTGLGATPLPKPCILIAIARMNMQDHQYVSAVPPAVSKVGARPELEAAASFPWRLP